VPTPYRFEVPLLDLGESQVVPLPIRGIAEYVFIHAEGMVLEYLRLFF
jgi:hypothetical protein